MTCLPKVTDWEGMIHLKGAYAMMNWYQAGKKREATVAKMERLKTIMRRIDGIMRELESCKLNNESIRFADAFTEAVLRQIENALIDCCYAKNLCQHQLELEQRKFAKLEHYIQG